MVCPGLSLKIMPVTAGCPLPVAGLSLTLPYHAKATVILTVRTIRAYLQGPPPMALSLPEHVDLGQLCCLPPCQP